MTGIERIGDAHGRIALYLDEQGARDLAETFGRSDSAYDELMEAVSRAYPPSSHRDTLGGRG